jgi:hypothetical protein
MIIISRADEISSLDGTVTDGGIQQLEALNYERYFALAVFQGYKHSTGYGIQVKHIGRIGNTVNVDAQLVEPPPNIAVGAMDTSPYHVVKVLQTGGWDQDITFNLISGKKLVASVAHMIP